MDLVLSTRSGPHQADKLRYCLRGLKHLEFDELFIIGPLPDGINLTSYRKVTVIGDEGANDFSRIATAASVMKGLGCYEFLYMPDNCMLMAPFKPMRFVNVGMMYRKPDDSAFMVNTIRFLLESDEIKSFDYELDIPMVFHAEKVLALVEKAGKKTHEYAMRSLYGNFYPGPHLRITNPYIPEWSHYDDPQSAVVALADKAMEHKQCMRWLQKKFPHRSKYEHS